ncbi:MAG: hypothetical protein HQL37_11605 [Alphaproteobacteria bacterium]|nr:hypothetical protein [Alphaproteobacteria bacterium]
MSDAIVAKMVDLLSGLSKDISDMASGTKQQTDTVMTALDDMAAHVLALQGIVLAMLEKVPVDAAVVDGWLDQRTKEFGGSGQHKSRAIAAVLLKGPI